jgi:hypothetical protein
LNTFYQDKLNITDAIKDRNGTCSNFNNNNISTSNVENKTFVLNVNVTETSTNYSSGFVNGQATTDVLKVATNTFFSDTSFNLTLGGSVLSRWGITYYFQDKGRWIKYDNSYNRDNIYDLSTVFVFDSYIPSNTNAQKYIGLSGGTFVVGIEMHKYGFPPVYYDSDFYGGMHELIVGSSNVSKGSVSTNFPTNQRKYIFDDFYY